MSVVHKQLIGGPSADMTRTLELPICATILSAGFQGDQIAVWYTVPSVGGITYAARFIVVGTGWEMPVAIGQWQHVSTLFQGPFVWHVFTDDV